MFFSEVCSIFNRFFVVTLRFAKPTATLVGGIQQENRFATDYRLHTSLPVPIQLYRCETKTLLGDTVKKIQVFESEEHDESTLLVQRT